MVGASSTRRTPPRSSRPAAGPPASDGQQDDASLTDDSASDSLAEAPPSKGSDATAALATIAQQIPAEGLAVYIAIYTVAPHLWLTGHPAGPNWMVAFACVVIAVAVNVFALAWAAHSSSGKLTAGGRALLRGKVFGQSVWLSILLLITITATAGNPFELFLGFPSYAGGALAVIAAAIIAIMANSSSKAAT